MKVAYFLVSFPKISETFILNEIIELQRSGIDITIFSILNPEKDFIHKEAIELAEKTYYLRYVGNTSQVVKKLWAILFINFFLLIRNPISYSRTFWFFFKKNGFKIFPRFSLATYLVFILKKLKIDHIHAHFGHITAEYAMIVSILSNIPYSFTTHAQDIFSRFELIDKKIEFAEFVIAISEYNKKYLVDKCQNINSNKINIIHCGVDLKRLSFLTHKLNDEKRPFVILCVGRLVEKKGFQYLLQACHILMQQEISDFVCQIVGHGSLKRELEVLSLRLNLAERVQFLGSLPSDRVFTLLQEADIAVLPSVVGADGDMDGIPVSLMEAMALEKPVISTSISGIPELVRDGAGLLVPPQNAKALSEAIETLYLMDSESRKIMGHKGREIVKREFNIEKESQKIKNLFVSSLQEKVTR